MRRLLSVAPVLLWLVAPLAFTQLPGITSQPPPGGGRSQSLPVRTLVFITSLTFIPAILLMITGFTRIVIVFGLLRNTLGTPSAPPNQVLLGLALFLAFFIMLSVIDKIYVNACQPFNEEKISMQRALEKGAQSLRESALRQTHKADLGLFARLTNTGPLQGSEAAPMRILPPAYVTSKLKTAFQIGFTIFIPFSIIDLMTANMLMALGVMTIPPATIALSFKLMLFILVDGWQLLVGSLAQSFYSQRGKMTPESVMTIGAEAMKVVLTLAALLLLVALITGLIIGILQTATQINKMMLSFIPEVVAVFIVIIIIGPWMLNLLLDCVHTLFTNLPCIIGQTVQ